MYCTECGNRLKVADEYCTTCGAVVIEKEDIDNAENNEYLDSDTLIYKSTTDTIAGHNIIRHGKIIYVEESHYYVDFVLQEMVDDRLDRIAKCNGYNGIVGLRYAVRNEELYRMSAYGTLVEVD